MMKPRKPLLIRRTGFRSRATALAVRRNRQRCDRAPSPARVRNQTVVIGPKTSPTLAVPRDWTMKRPMRMPPASTGTVQFGKARPGQAPPDAFHRRQDRNRRGDNAVAVEERRTDNPERQNDRRPLSQGAQRQGHQGQGATLALVVGLHQEIDVLERHDQQQRPEHQRDDAQNRQFAGAPALGMRERLSHGVERTGADIAEHNADGAECESEEGRLSCGPSRRLAALSSVWMARWPMPRLLRAEVRTWLSLEERFVSRWKSVQPHKAEIKKPAQSRRRKRPRPKAPSSRPLPG